MALGAISFILAAHLAAYNMAALPFCLLPAGSSCDCAQLKLPESSMQSPPTQLKQIYKHFNPPTVYLQWSDSSLLH